MKDVDSPPDTPPPQVEIGDWRSEMKIGVNASQAYPSHLWPRGAYATAVGGAQSLANLSSAKLTPTEGKVRPDARVALMIEVRPLRAACNALASAVEALRPNEWRISHHVLAWRRQCLR